MENGHSQRAWRTHVARSPSLVSPGISYELKTAMTLSKSPERLDSSIAEARLASGREVIDPCSRGGCITTTHRATTQTSSITRHAQTPTHLRNPVLVHKRQQVVFPQLVQQWRNDISALPRRNGRPVRLSGGGVRRWARVVLTRQVAVLAWG